VRSLAVALTCLIALPAAAGPLVPTRPSQVVVLVPTATDKSPCNVTGYPVDQMRASDGTVSPFVIPEKQVFVVTSVDVFGSADEPNRRYFFSLGLNGDGPVPGGTLVVGDAGLTDAFGGYSGSVTVPTGVVVPRGQLLCARLSGPNDEPTFMRVHGFFAKDK
jgi:hypothetical protein